MHRDVRLRTVVALLAVAAATAGVASASVRPVRAADRSLLARVPTADERVAQQVADRLTRKHVAVRCGRLGVPGAAWPNGITGITLFVGDKPAGYAVLLPAVCAQLTAFRRDPEAWDPARCADASCDAAVAHAAMAIATVTHESYHLLGYRNEAQVECYGMQSIWYAATKLGASVREGQALAHFYAAKLYPRRRTQTPAYWSPQCRDGGRYDLRSRSHAWPS